MNIYLNYGTVKLENHSQQDLWGITVKFDGDVVLQENFKGSKWLARYKTMKKAKKYFRVNDLRPFLEKK